MAATHDASPPNVPPESHYSVSYDVARYIMLRLMATVYLFAFTASRIQNPGLIGSNGIMPFRPPEKHDVSLFHFVEPTDKNLSRIALVGLYVSIFLTLRPFTFDAPPAAGWSKVVSAVPWIVSYALYATILHAGESSSTFFNYGWEAQILEQGMICVFLAVGGGWKTHSSGAASASEYPWVSWMCIWLCRWLILRISFGEGLTKFRGHGCWHDRTCLFYHFETQPLPSPASFYYHFLPKHILSYGVDVDFVVQLYLIWLCILPDFLWLGSISKIFRSLRALGGAVQVVFIIRTASFGNQSFLNLLTMIPPIACIDDDMFKVIPFRFFLPKKTQVAKSSIETKTTDADAAGGKSQRYNFSWFSVFFIYPIFAVYFYALVFLSVPVFNNLFLSSRQVMSHSIGPKWLRQSRILNTYGAFSSVGKEGQGRYEPVVMVQFDSEAIIKQIKKELKQPVTDRAFNTTDMIQDLIKNYSREGFKLVDKMKDLDSKVAMIEKLGEYWFELEFACKPTTTSRRPCMIAPYQYRLDWNIWFTGFMPGHMDMVNGREQWIYPFLNKVLQNDRNVLGLLANPSDCGNIKNPNSCINKWLWKKNFPKPKMARIEMYHYWFARKGKEAPIDVDKPRVWPPNSYHKKPTKIAGVGNVSGVRRKKEKGGKLLWWNRKWSSTLVFPAGRDIFEKLLGDMQDNGSL